MASSVGARLAKGLLGTIFALLLTTLLIEGGWRLFLRFEGAPYDGAATAAAIEEKVAGMRELLPGVVDQEHVAGHQRVVHPYLGWDVLPKLELVDTVTRQAASRDDRSAGTYEIWVLGGSVAALFGRPSAGARVLVEELAKEPAFAGRELFVRNFGRPSYKQPQQLLFLAYMLSLGAAPDLVLNLDGFNEVAIGNHHGKIGVHPTFPSVNQWRSLVAEHGSNPAVLDLRLGMRALERESESLGQRALEGGWTKSAVLGTLALRRLEAQRLQWTQLFAAYESNLAQLDLPGARGPDTTGLRATPVELAVANWAECSRAMDALCERFGARYLHVLQPTLHDEGSKPLTDEERRTGAASDAWVQGVRQGYPLLRQAGERLAADGVAFEDATGAFGEVEETLYYDACHFHPAGNAILATEMAQAIASL